jgi:hypothetical protein
MSSPIWSGSSSLIEASDSPDWSFSEKITCTRVFRGPYATALSSAPFPGAAGTGDLLNYYVKSSRVSREERGIGKLQIIYEAGNDTFEGGGPSALLPPDECGITMERLDRPIETHPRYSMLSDEMVDSVKLLLQNYDEYKADYEADVLLDSVASEMWSKMKRGFTVYPIWVPVYRWAIHSWTCPSASEGGFIETPYGPITGPSIDWLRQADSINFNGTHWVLERSWIGGPEVDTDVYPAA